MRTRRHLRHALLPVLAALLLAACGTGDVAGPATSGPGEAPADRGWVGGEPDWDGGEGGAAGRADDAASESGAVAPSPAGPGGSDGSDDSGDVGLRAGSVDDNADFDRYLDYLDRIGDLGIPLRGFDPTGRIVVGVVGSDGRPIAGAEVTVTQGGDQSDGAVVATLRTVADGSARFHPASYGLATDGIELTFSAAGVDAVASAGDELVLALDEPGGRPGPVALDVLFLLDATGSMGDEIDRLKQSIEAVADRVAALEGAPDVRFAMTLYRDEGDAFVTATRDFTADVEEFRADLASVVAHGGGDYPEALEEGLADALAEPSWRDPATTVGLVFLVADAPPQIGRTVDQPYDASIREAIARGIKVFPVASSESDDQAEAVFRQLAQGTGARFVFLSYGAGGAATGTGSDITSTDYEELALDDLVVRLIAEELAALTGDAAVVPPPTPTTTTQPPDQ